MPRSLVVVTDPDELVRKIEGLALGDSVVCRSGTFGRGSNLIAGGLVVTVLLLNLTRPFSFLAAAAAAAAADVDADVDADADLDVDVDSGAGAVADADASPMRGEGGARDSSNGGELPLALEPRLGDAAKGNRST